VFSTELTEGRQEVLTIASCIHFSFHTLFQSDQICLTSPFGDSTSPSYLGDCKYDFLGECEVALMIIFVVVSVPPDKCWASSLKYPVNSSFLILNTITHDSCLMRRCTYGKLGKTVINPYVLISCNFECTINRK